MQYAQIAALGPRFGITGLTAEALEDYEKQSDGLSGGVSKLYAAFGKEISCHRAGVAHDWLYDRGGTERDRKKADRLFAYACAFSGKTVPGWLAYVWELSWWSRRSLTWLPPLRRLWRIYRALIMYRAVRRFAGGPEHWNSNNVAAA